MMDSARYGRFYVVLLGCLLLMGLLAASSASGDDPPAVSGLANPTAADVWDPNVVQSPDKYIVRQVTHNGKKLNQAIFPVRPPSNFVMPAANLPIGNPAAGFAALPTVPAFDWSYGCSATAAAMMMGFYDNTGYPNMYSGPANGGVVPMDNSVWGAGECPLSATHQGYDGLTTTGHVDDYWVAYLSDLPDPFTGNWPEHTWADCTGDFMGTNQKKYENVDGSTTFFYYPDGTPLYDFSGEEPKSKDGCHGMRQFVESRGYNVLVNFTQAIRKSGMTQGFTFADYVREIDHGRPVLIQVSGHTMLGFGYNTDGNVVYLHDTWDYSNHAMTWGASYAGMAHFGVTVLQMDPATPSITSVTPASGLDLGPVTITDIAGANFAEGFTVRLTKAGQPDIIGSSRTYNNWMHVAATFDLTGKAEGKWDVVLTNANGKSATLPEAFTIVDGTPVPVTINQAASQTDPTNDVEINFTAVFANPVVDFSGSAVLVSGTAGGTKTVSVTGSGKTYNVAVSGMTGNGTVVATIPAGRVHDSIGAPNEASTSTDNTVTYDSTGPNILISAPSAERVNTGPVSFTLTFTDAASVDMTADDVVLNKTGTADGIVEVSGDGTEERLVTISGVSGDGTFSIALNEGIALDTLGNPSSAVGPSASIVVDNTGPQPAISGPTVSLTRSGPVSYTVTYPDAASVSLTAADVILNTTGTATGTVTVTGDGTVTRTIEIGETTGDGTLGISLMAGTAVDDLGNAALSAGPSDVVTIDNTGPMVNVVGPEPLKTNHGPVRYVLQFTDAASVVMASGDISVETTGSAVATASVSGTGKLERTVLLNGVSGNGTLDIVVAPGVATDIAGNPSVATFGPTPVLVDNVGPTITIGAPSVTSTTVGPVSYVLTFDDAAKISLDAAEVKLNKTGSADATVAVSGVGLFSRTVTLYDITGSGSLGISIPANAAMDSLGNFSSAAGPSATFTIDSEPPVVTVSGPTPASTKSGPVKFTATYSGATTVTLDTADITLNKTGTADGTVSVSGAGLITRTITVSGITGNGTLGVTVAAGTAADAAGNMTESSGLSATVTVDNEGPVIELQKPCASVEFARNSSDLVLAGSASDDSGVAKVSWYLTGGTPETCAGTTAWATQSIDLAEGANEVVLEAEDKLGNTTRTTIQPTFIRSEAGAAWHSIAMVSIPVIPDTADPKDVVGFSGNYWLTYSPTIGGYVSYPSTATWFNPLDSTLGRGFWAKFASDGHSVVGTVPAQNVERVIELQRGWNIVGVPFIKPVEWDPAVLQVESGGVRKPLGESFDLISNFAWGWNAASGAYYLVTDPSVAPGASDRMQPWQAYWIKASAACKLIMPAP